MESNEREAILAAFRDVAKDPQRAQDLLLEVMKAEAAIASPTEEGGPTDDELWQAFQQARAGEAPTPPQPGESEAGERTDQLTDDEFWTKLPESFKRGEQT